MAKRITKTTPKQDGFRMPGEFEEQKQIWMLWPWRNDNWRLEAKVQQVVRQINRQQKNAKKKK